MKRCVWSWLLSFTAFVSFSVGCAGKQPVSSPTRALAQPALVFFALSVADADASSAWYERVLGFEKVRSVDNDGGSRMRLLQLGEARVELMEVPDARPLGEAAPEVDRDFLVHGPFKVGFRVRSLDETRARLAELGIPLFGRVIELEAEGVRFLQVRVPDGVIIQLFEYLY